MQTGWPRKTRDLMTETAKFPLARHQPLPWSAHLQVPHCARQGAALRPSRLHRRHLLQQALRQALQLQRHLRVCGRGEHRKE